MTRREASPPRGFHPLLHVARDRVRPLTAKTPSREEINDAGIAIRRAALQGNGYPKLLPLVHDAEAAVTMALEQTERRAELLTKADDLLATVLGEIHVTDPD